MVELDKMYLKYESYRAYEAYEAFEISVRPSGMGITEYVINLNSCFLQLNPSTWK